MLACNHDRAPFGSPMCSHLRGGRDWIKCVRWYIGSGMDTELLCVACAEKREHGFLVDVESVCQECFEYATEEVCDLTGVSGKPEIRVRDDPFDSTLKETLLPKELGKIVGIAPVNRSLQSIWLLLADDGKIFRLNAASGEFMQVALSSAPAEPDAKTWAGHELTRRLHASNNGEFIAVVNDYGRYGQIIDLRSGKVTLSLDGGTYHPETVPFSFSFADTRTSVVAIHRTAWNRLDFSDPSTGKLLSERGPSSHGPEEKRPEHYLDYFHGALYVNPTSKRILDDGWIWHPVGMPTTWSLNQWFAGNVWESEDGATKTDLCLRDYYWDEAMTWFDENRVAIGGLGDDDRLMVDGARIFDVTKVGESRRGRADWHWALEVIAFPGPAGKFFSDGNSLFSSCESGLSRWCIEDGARTGNLEGFQPTHHHRGAGELVQLNEGVLVRWKMRSKTKSE